MCCSWWMSARRIRWGKYGKNMEKHGTELALNLGSFGYIGWNWSNLGNLVVRILQNDDLSFVLSGSNLKASQRMRCWPLRMVTTSFFFSWDDDGDDELQIQDIHGVSPVPLRWVLCSSVFTRLVLDLYRAVLGLSFQPVQGLWWLPLRLFVAQTELTQEVSPVGNMRMRLRHCHCTEREKPQQNQSRGFPS